MPSDVLEPIQTHLGNTLDPAWGKKAVLTGIIGDQPSRSAKSPVLWNAAFQGLSLDAYFMPFDVTSDNLPDLVGALRDTPNFLGGSVTVPHKSAIMEYLDEVDPKARQIGAVNAVARTTNGGFIGYNTDAQGAVDSLIKSMPWQQKPFLSDLTGLSVLLIGAGGAARAVAFAIGESIRATGQLTIANRDYAKASQLASSANNVYGNTTCVPEQDISSVLSDADLIINASLRGQSGLRQDATGNMTCLEPYSSLAPANPAAVGQNQHSDALALQKAWYRASLDDINKNNALSSQAVLQAKPGAAFLDIIFSPLETRLLNQARLAGHPTLNGMGMNLAQAVDGFIGRVMHAYITDKGWDIDQTYDRVFQLMAQVW